MRVAIATNQALNASGRSRRFLKSSFNAPAALTQSFPLSKPDMLQILDSQTKCLLFIVLVLGEAVLVIETAIMAIED